MSMMFTSLAIEITSAIGRAPDSESAMRTAVEMLKDRLPRYTWVGIYLLDGDELVLGPYLGKPTRHVRIPLDRGICGAAASQKTTIVVDDVNSDPRYLACSLETNSEIVVPIMAGELLVGEFDIESDLSAAFGPRDQALLAEIARALADRVSALAR